MGIGGDSVLVPGRPLFWIDAEVVCVLGAMTALADTLCYAAMSRGEGPSTRMGIGPAASPQPLEVEAVAKGEGGPAARMGPGSSAAARLQPLKGGRSQSRKLWLLTHQF